MIGSGIRFREFILGSGISFRDSFSVQGFGSGIYTWFRDFATSLRESYIPLRKSLSLKGIIFLILKISLKGRSGTKFMLTDGKKVLLTYYDSRG